ncbi:MAG: diacylglycerol kinase family protein [Gemmatales bacterium]
MPAPFCIIYNPHAGRGGSAITWSQVRELLGTEAEYRPTSHAGQATELAQQAAEDGFATVVAAGGDGTVHEVINGLLQSERHDVAFGVLPLGSGNDYARLLHVPFDAIHMVGRLRSEETWAVDAGKVTLEGKQSRYFCNTCGMGIGGAVTWEASRIRWLRGIPLYGWASLKAIIKHFRSVTAKVTVDGVTMETGLLYAVAAIGQAEGGGFQVAPSAVIDDGWFNLMYVTRLSRLGALVVLPRLVVPGWRDGCKTIQEKLVREVIIETSQPVPLHADGEVLATPMAGIRQAVIQLMPGRLLVRGK